MLQQTRVAVVVEAYRRFVGRFPTAASLAAAPRAEVLAQWSGLGYYHRADRLQRAAHEIVARGGVPREPAELRRLPGVGAYTAAAVASIAFGAAEPVLDGNVLRVLARVHAERASPTRVAVRDRLRAAAAALLDPKRPGDSNQALMELGATVCLPRRPLCDACPLSGLCAGRHAPERYPARARARARSRVAWLLLVIERGGEVLLVQRDDDATFLAGMWLLPWAEASRGEAAALREAGERLGTTVVVEGAARGTLRHAITFRDFEVTVARARVAGRRSRFRPSARAGWFDAAARAALPRSSLVEKALGSLARAERALCADSAQAPMSSL